MEERKGTLYFIHVKDFDGATHNFVGPALEDEIDEIIAEDFESDNVEVVDESIFKSLYYECYQADFNEHWYHYIGTKLLSLGINSDYYEVEGDDDDIMLSINEFGSIFREDDKIILNVDMDSVPHMVGLISCEVTKYCGSILEVVVNQPVYVTNSEEVVVNDDAYNLYNIEKLGMMFLN